MKFAFLMSFYGYGDSCVFYRRQYRASGVPTHVFNVFMTVNIISTTTYTSQGHAHIIALVIGEPFVFSVVACARKKRKIFLYQS